MHRKPRMDEQRLIDALVARASEDARAFRDKNPDDAPTERWIENSFTGALPLAKDDAGFDPGPAAHPRLFSAYRREIERRVGERVSRRDDDGGELQQQPMRGQP
jgi:hypothetical protein